MEKRNEPLLLRPAGKDYLWGGKRLNDEYGKNIELSPLAETWECSTHPDGVSTVRCGTFDKMDLTAVIKAHPEYLGERHKGETTLPILVKLIDARKDLSVQVHPDDDYAKMKEHGQLGKTEMWYVLDAARDAKLIYGLRQDCTKKEMQKALAEGTVMKRELHIDKALDVADLHGSAEPRQPLRVLKYRPGMASELLIRCKYFEVYRMLINTERRQTVHYRADRMAFRVLLCMDGCGTISYDEGTVNFYKGDCVFVPADSEVLTIHGQAQFLDIRG